MNSFLRVLLFFLLNGFTIQSQTLLGTISNEDGKPIKHANVLLKNDGAKKILAFSNVDNKGEYLIKLHGKGKYQLEIVALGYEVKTIVINNNLFIKNKIINNFTLKIKPIEFEEIIVKVEKSITIKKDTIRFKTKHFKNGNEQVVEDLLRKIPGLNVNSKGVIRVGNQEIEKLMIDGDDFFEKGYKLISKNLPVHAIEEVEVLKNYSNNSLLKGIEKDNKIAVNLKLDKKYKRIWFGNIEVDLGNDKFYQLKGNLMNFGKKNKYYFFTNFNNIGYDSTGDINYLIRPFHSNEAASVGDNQKVSNLLDFSISNLNFKQNRINFNNDKLLSLNAIFNPSEKLKIKTLGFFNFDEIDFFRNTLDIVDVTGTRYTNAEEYSIINRKKTVFGKLDVTYNISKTKKLKTTTKYNNANFNGNSNLVFNGNSTIDNLQFKNELFDQKINYSNRFKKNEVFLLTGRFINEKTPQNYSSNQFLYQELFQNFSNANNIRQESTNQMQFLGVRAHLLNRKANGHLFELQFGNEFRKDKLTTNFSLLENNLVLNNPSHYQNETSYQVNDLYFKSKYLLKLNDFGIESKIDVHQFWECNLNSVCLIFRFKNSLIFFFS